MTLEASIRQLLGWSYILLGVLMLARCAQASPPGTGWGLLYADEFGGNSVDTMKWGTMYPWGSHTHNHDAYMLPQNLSESNGILTETAIRETAPDGKPFTSGMITTGNIFSYTYGYAEARIKLPSRLGSWPAFWGLYTGWPPESDIMEFPCFTSGDDFTNYNVAYHYNLPNPPGGNSSYAGWTDPSGVGDLRTTYHTYGMEWSSTNIKYYFDGSLMWNITDTAAIAQMGYMYLILNYAVGNLDSTHGWPGTPNTTLWPVGATDTTQIDWVRVWKNASSYPASTTWTNASGGSWDTSSNWSAGSPQLNTQTATFGSVAASNVTVDWGNSRTVGGLVFNSSVNYTLGSGNDSIMLTSTTPITSEQPNSNTILIDASSATGSSPNIINSRLELYNNVTIRSPNKPMTINGPITGLGSLRIDSGQIILNNSVTYSGSTTIAGGTLKLGASPVTVAHRWSFNNSLTDSVGGSNATIVDVGANNVTLGSTEATLAGGARDSSDYIRLGSNLLPDANAPIALEFWATPKSIQNWSRIFDFGSGTTENLFMSWTKDINQHADRVEWLDAETNTSDNTNQPYNPNTEYHIVMVLRPLGSSTEVTWYSAPSGSANLGPAKGSFITTPITGNTLASFLDSEDNLGRSFYSDNTANASYDEVRFWNGPINSTILEILQDAGPDADLNSLNIGLAGGELPTTTAVNITGSGATLDLNGICQTIGSLSGVAGSSVLLGSGVLTTGGNNTSTTFSGIISGSGGLTKTGSGIFTISGANTYGGTTTISSGVLKTGAINALPSGSGKGNVSIALGAILDLGSYSQTVNGLTGNGTVDNTGGGNPLLTVGANDVNSTFNGVVQNTSGSMGLAKIGTGVITLTGTNSYGGTTSVLGGVLEIKNASALGNTSAGTTVENGASLHINIPLNIGNEALSLKGVGDGSGALRIGGTSTVNYGGAVNLADAALIKVDADSLLNFTNASGITGSNKDLTFIIDEGAIAAVTGILDLGSGNLTKENSGNLILSGSSVSIGSVALAGGSLEVDSVAASVLDITGSGKLAVGNGSTAASLTVNSINVGSLYIGPGAKLAVRAVALGEPLADPSQMQAVPEPATWICTLMAAIALLCWRWRNHAANPHFSPTCRVGQANRFLGGTSVAD